MTLFDKLNKYVVIAIYSLLIITLVNGCNGCSSNKENVKLRKQVDSLSTAVENLNSSIYSKEELDVRLEILSLETEKSTLFNTNYIVLTKERPDKRMNELDQKIKELQDSLGEKARK